MIADTRHGSFLTCCIWLSPIPLILCMTVQMIRPLLPKQKPASDEPEGPPALCRYADAEKLLLEDPSFARLPARDRCVGYVARLHHQLSFQPHQWQLCRSSPCLVYSSCCSRAVPRLHRIIYRKSHCAGSGSGASLLRTSSLSEMILQLRQSVAGCRSQVMEYAHCQGNWVNCLDTIPKEHVTGAYFAFCQVP